MLQSNPLLAERIIGVDIGDVRSHVCVIDHASGEVLEETRIPTRPEAFKAYFEQREPMAVALEAGTHSNWTSSVITEAGHAVTVANASRVR